MPACMKWRVPEQIRRNAVWYSSDGYSTDPAERADAQLGVIWYWQKRRCAICGRLWSNRGANICGPLRTDHDHETNRVRGLLCHGCNTQEGRLDQRNPQHLKYRVRHPAAILGLDIPYSSSWKRSDAAPVDAEVYAARLRRLAATLSQQPYDPAVVDELKALSATMARELLARSGDAIGRKLSV